MLNTTTTFFLEVLDRYILEPCMFVNLLMCTRNGICTQVTDGLEGIPKSVDLAGPSEFTVSLPSSSTGCVSALLQPLATGNSATECTVTPLEQGLFRVSLTPDTRGRHQLSIKANEQEITGSPFQLFVRQCPEQLGKPLRVFEGVGSPAGVVLRRDSELIVTETEPAGVSVWSKQGERKQSFEAGEGPLDNPYGVAVDSQGCVYVADLVSCSLHKFSGDGSLLKSIQGSPEAHLAFPAGIEMDSKDRLFVCDDSNQKIHVFDQNLELLFSFGEAGDKPGQLQSPSDLAFDPDGHLVVADTKREKVIKFTSEGKFLTEFEVKGQSAELELGIFIDGGGYIYISDFWNNRVVVFSSSGDCLTSFGVEGSRPGEFNAPAGITVDQDGFVYVCDQRNGRLQVF